MPWECRYHATQLANPQAGDIWPLPITDPLIQAYYEQHVFSDEYLRDWNGKRPALMICLPGAGPRILDQRWGGSSRGWAITGEAPNLTASPSIWFEGRYHGYLVNGVLSDDVDGRTF